MKYICIKTHEQPDPEPGKFKRYEAGEEYELAEADEALFRAVYGEPEAKIKIAPEFATKGTKGTKGTKVSP